MGSALVDLGKGSAFLQSSPSNVSRLFQSPSILLFQFRPREFVLVAGQVHKPRARDGREFRCGGVVRLGLEFEGAHEVAAAPQLDPAADDLIQLVR
mgnify:FL=1